MCYRIKRGFILSYGLSNVLLVSLHTVYTVITASDHGCVNDATSFARYLLTLNEEINLQIVCDTLEDRGVLSPSDKDDVLQQGTYKDRIDTCIQRVLKTCPTGFTHFCEVLKDCGYNHVVENLKTETDDEDSISKCKD